MTLSIRYVLAALLLIGSPFSIASTLYVSTAPGSTGTQWVSKAAGCVDEVHAFCSVGGDCYNGVGNPYSTAEPSPAGYCYYYKSNTALAAFNQWSSVSGSCPSGYVDDGAGNCIEGPAYTCSAGKVIMAQVTKSGGNFPSDICIPQSSGGTDYCLFNRISGPVITESDTMSLVYSTASESPSSCETPDPDINQIVRFPFNPDQFTGQITEQDTYFTKSDNTYSPPNSVCSSNGDGTDTCVTITSRTETILSGQGTTTTSDGSTVTQITDAGTTTTKSETTQITDDGHGTTTKTTTTTNTAKAGQSEQQTVNGNDGSSTTTIIRPEGQQITTQQTTTEVTHPDGSVSSTTSSNTQTSDGTSTDPLPDPEAPGNCGAPDQPACAVTLGNGDELTDPTPTIEGMKAGAFDLYDTAIVDIENIDTDEPTFLELTSPDFHSGRTCDPTAYSSEYHGENFSPFAGFCSFYDDDMRPILAWSLYIITAFGLWRLYVRTIKGGE